MQGCDIGDKRREPRLTDLAPGCIDQQRGADLDDNPAKILELGKRHIYSAIGGCGRARQRPAGLLNSLSHGTGFGNCWGLGAMSNRRRKHGVATNLPTNLP